VRDSSITQTYMYACKYTKYRFKIYNFHCRDVHTEMTDTKQQKCNEYISYLKLNYKLKKTLRGQNMDGDGGRQAPWFSTSLVHVD